MAKRGKSRKKKKAKPTVVSPKVVREVRAAMDLFEHGDEDERRDAFRKVEQIYWRRPRDPLLLACMQDLCMGFDNLSGYLYFAEKLLHFEEGYDRIKTLQNLVAAAKDLFYPAMAWEFSQQLAGENPTYRRDEAYQSFNEALEKSLVTQANLNKDIADLSYDQQLEVMVANDRIRFYAGMKYGKEDGAVLAKRVLAKYPELTSFSNNLSFIYFRSGDIDQAKAAALRVLKIDPYNFHALSNLVRFTFLTAHFDKAYEYKDRLLAVINDHFDLPLKQIEALSFLGEAETILEIYKQWEASGQSTLSQKGLFFHLVAVAAYETGDEPLAWSLWEKSVREDPDFEMPKRCLDEKGVDRFDRNLPWYWSFPYWFAGDVAQQLADVVTLAETEEDAEWAFQTFLSKRPQLEQLIPHMLERGDDQVRDFAVHVIQTRIFDSQALYEAAYRFACSDRGPDRFRWELIDFIGYEYPEMLPANKRVSGWWQGESHTELVPGFRIRKEEDFVYDPIGETEIGSMHEARHYIDAKAFDKAVPLLQALINEAPDFHLPYSLLHIVYLNLGEDNKASSIIDAALDRFPDQVIYQLEKGLFLIDSDRLEEAEALIQPIMARTELSLFEFSRLALVGIQLAIKTEASDDIDPWISMWEKVDPDNDLLHLFQQKMYGTPSDGSDG